ncbi:MAG TPA: radical SAM protein, partial [Clostridiales bacterium]|nr:radical SAM protein [Clostridiales bacterium]
MGPGAAGDRERVMRFDTLTATAAVSVTGTACAVRCAHCGGHYLRGMLSPAEASRLAASGGGRLAGRRVRSFLVSGGCRPDGAVPLLEHEGLLEELGRAGRLNLHAGLVRTEEQARALARHAAAVSLDFTVDQQTIDEVYGFRGVKALDFVRAYELLSGFVPVTPHVLVGLHGGRVRGEGEAVRVLASLGARAVVFLVFIPTRGSRFEGVEPPPVGEVLRVLDGAREALPDASIVLGCMRPKGSYREKLDTAAVRARVVDRVAVP